MTKTADCSHKMFTVHGRECAREGVCVRERKREREKEREVGGRGRVRDSRSVELTVVREARQGLDGSLTQLHTTVAQ